MRLALVLMWLSLSTIGYAGGRAGNGFALECRDDKDHGLKAGYYSLDYLATLGLGASVKVKSWKESSGRIRKRLKGVLTAKQLALYDDFVATVRNEDYAKSRVWEASPFGVVNLKTEASAERPGKDPLHKEQLKTNLESLVQKVPDACLDTKGEIGLIPAVVFQDSFFTGRPEGYLVYKFVPKVLDSLEVNDPLQLSYLYIHEWLWDISNNEDRNRRINHLLHSEKADDASAGELREQLKGMGLDLGANESKPGTINLESSELEDSYEQTKIPERAFGLSAIERQLFKGNTLLLSKPYTAHALSRRCPTPQTCTAWQTAKVYWKDLGRRHDFPESGVFYLNRVDSMNLEIKTDTVKVDGGLGRVVETICQMDSTESKPYHGTCRKMWGPHADFEPIGHLWVDETSPDLQVTFTKSHVWIGAHTKRGENETRFALIAPYENSATIQADAGEKDGAWLHIPREMGVPSEGQRTIVNGQEEYVWTIPMNSVGNDGRFGSRQLVKHTLYAFTKPGKRRALRGYVVYDGDLESAGVTVKHLVKGVEGGSYGIMTDLDVLPLRSPVPGFPEFAKAAELRPGFAVEDARGDYQIEFDLRPAANGWARVHSLRLLMRTDRT